MVQNSIQIDPETRRLIDLEAQRRNISPSDVVRDVVRAALKEEPSKQPLRRTGPFWDDHETFDGPVDGIQNLDDYLYGDKDEQ